MKKISKINANRILNHLNRAKDLLDKIENDSQCSELCMDEKIAEQCLNALGAIEHCVINSVPQ